MPTNTTTVEIDLTRANAALAFEAAKILKTSVEEVLILCLTGSTNPLCAALPPIAV